MKILLFSTIFLAILIIPLSIGPFVPYYIYKKVVDNGFESKFLTLNVDFKKILKGKRYSFTKSEREFLETNKKRWRRFHLKNFLVPFPIFHPTYNLVPVVIDDLSGKKPGAKFVNNKGVNFGEFILGNTFTLKRPFKKQLLFGLPVFKKFLLKIPEKKIWADLFEKNLEFPSGKLTSISYLKKVIKINYFELVYRLFLIEMRKEILGENIEDFYFISEKKIGVIIPKGKSNNIKTLKLLLFRNGNIYTVSLRYLATRKEGKNLKTRIINSLDFRPSSEEIAKKIYLKFKSLSYREQISSKGTVYLFSAWSHFLKNKEFVREMIQFLERSRGNDLVLQELYRYSFKNFGTTFSKREKFLKETQMLKLKRKIEKEEKAFIDKERKSEVHVPDSKFLNKEERVKTYLQDAKTEGSDLDEEDEVLIVE
ncbi:MAG: hypothetical protein VYD54_13355 [Bdellovibrionota bacterium]|nr:hypothetical protein [Bdellovibrionota bacterium]